MLPPIGGIGAACPPITPRVASSNPLGEGDGGVADRRSSLRYCHLASRHLPLLVVDPCDLRLQVVHGHLLSPLAVDVRDGQRPVDVRFSGDKHQAAAEVLEGLHLRNSDDARHESFSIEEARSNVQ